MAIMVVLMTMVMAMTNKVNDDDEKDDGGSL